MSARNNMGRILKLAIGAALVMGLVAAGWAHADINQAGTTAANFLSIGSGARTLGMGGTILGFNDDVAGGAWNPGALAWTRGTEMVLSHAGLDDGSSQEWLGLAGRFGQSRTTWMLSGLYQGNGTIEGRDASNVSTGTLSLASFAFGAHVAHQVTDQLGIGVAAKGVSEQLGDVSGLGVTFDAGATFRSGNFGLGIAGQNMGGQMRYAGTPYPFPWNVGAGVAYFVPQAGLRFGLDVNLPKAYYNDVRFGAEWRWREMVALRAGYRHEMSDVGQDPLSGPSFGVGAGANGWWIDYGYLIPGQGEAQHRMGVTFSPGRILGGSSDGYGKLDAVATDRPAPKPVAAKVEKAPKPAKTPKTKPMKATGSDAAPNGVPAESQAKQAEPKPVAAEMKPLAPVPAEAKPEAAPKKSKSKASDSRPTRITVKEGDTLAAIGRRLGVSAAAIMMENNLTSEQIFIGQVLKVPPQR